MPYLLIAPSHCFVLDDGDGKAVGYVIGTPNNKRFVDDYRNRYLPTLDRNVLPEPGTGLEGDEKREGEELLKVVYEPEEALLHSKWPRLLEVSMLSVVQCHLDGISGGRPAVFDGIRG